MGSCAVPAHRCAGRKRVERIKSFFEKGSLREQRYKRREKNEQTDEHASG